MLIFKVYVTAMQDSSKMGLYAGPRLQEISAWHCLAGP